MLSWHGSCERYALSLVAAGCRWSLLLLSLLLSIRFAPNQGKSLSADRVLRTSVVCDRARAWILS
jgi:hypothetical protein